MCYYILQISTGKDSQQLADSWAQSMAYRFASTKDMEAQRTYISSPSDRPGPGTAGLVRIRSGNDSQPFNPQPKAVEDIDKGSADLWEPETDEFVDVISVEALVCLPFAF